MIHSTQAHIIPKMHAASGSYSDGDAYLKALSNIRLVYRRAEKLSGLSRDNFESLPTVFRQHYYKTALEQFENKALCDELAMSRIRTVSLPRSSPLSVTQIARWSVGW